MSVGSAPGGETDAEALNGADTGIDDGTASCCGSEGAAGAGGFDTASAAAYNGMKITFSFQKYK